MKDYLSKESNVNVFHGPITKEYGGKKFYLAHGDGLGPGDRGYKFIKKIFTNKSCRWLFSKLHPDAGISLANYFSRRSRKHTGEKDAVFLGEDKEWLILHSKAILKMEHMDFFIYGHRHLPLMMPLSPASTYVNLGDWINHFSYAVWDGKTLKLEYFKE